MSESKEPKVTECWALMGVNGCPASNAIPTKTIPADRPAILMWREHYEQLVKERDEYQKRCRYNLDPGAQITCWDEYESLRVRLLECEGERESWKAECKNRGEEIESLRKELEQLRTKVSKWKPLEPGQSMQFVMSADAPRITHHGEIVESDTEDHGTK